MVCPRVLVVALLTASLFAIPVGVRLEPAPMISGPTLASGPALETFEAGFPATRSVDAPRGLFPQRLQKPAAPEAAYKPLVDTLMDDILFELAAARQAAQQQEEEEVLEMSSAQGAGDEGPGRGGARGWLRDFFTDNFRADLDVLVRYTYERRRGDREMFYAVGIDSRKVISGRQGDIGVLVLQPYVVRRHDTDPQLIPAHVDKNEINTDDTEIELHDFYFNLTRWGQGKRNIKIGHFDVPYGLEPNTDTHFTLHQLMPANLGMKKDWGVSLNGVTRNLDYEVAVLRGSGMQYRNQRGSNYAVAGRVGSPADENFVVGLSAFYGKVFDPHGVGHWEDGLSAARTPGALSGAYRDADNDLVERRRIGADATLILNQFTIKAEASGGRDFEQDIFNAIGEINWTNPEETLSSYAQVTQRGLEGEDGWDEDTILHVGADVKLFDNVLVGAQYRRRLNQLGGHDDDHKFIFQLRYLFSLDKILAGQNGDT